MKIAALLHRLDAGSFAMLATTLLPCFQQLGIEVEAVVAGWDATPEAAFGFPVHRIGSGPRSIFALARYLRKSRPDILMPMPMSKNVIGLLARQLSFTKTRVVITEHTTMSDELYREHPDNKKMRLLYPPLVRALYPLRDGLIYPTQAVARDPLFSRLIDVDARPHRAIHNPVPAREESVLASSPAHPWLSRSREMPVVLGVGRLVEQKGFDVLIRAVKRLHDRHRPVRLVILGEDENRPELESLVKELGLSAFVQMPGYVDNVPGYMASADLFALSSRWETFGLVLVEAMKAGLPIVSTRVPGGPEEILEDGRTAVLIQVEDAASLAAGIQRVLDDPALAARLSENGLLEARRYQPEAVAGQYVAFFEEVLGKGATAETVTRSRADLNGSTT